MSSVMIPVIRAMTNIGGLPACFLGDISEWIFEDYFDVMVYFEVLYILMVFLGPKAMENRKPFELRPAIAAWNLFLSVFSFCGTFGVGTLLICLLEERGMYEVTCHFDKDYVFDGEYSFWLMAFLLSKIPEMIDTLFLVLTKKPIIFLHWYHHLTVSIFCWYAGLSLIPSGLWFASMNYAVHAVMYLYYFLCTLGLRKIIRPLAPLITAAQLLQMIVGTAVVLYTFYYSYISSAGCDVDRRTIRMGMGMYGSYFGLFAALFVQLYLRKGGRNPGRRPSDSSSYASPVSNRMKNGNGMHHDGSTKTSMANADAKKKE